MNPLLQYEHKKPALIGPPRSTQAQRPWKTDPFDGLGIISGRRLYVALFLALEGDATECAVDLSPTPHYPSIASPTFQEKKLLPPSLWHSREGYYMARALSCD